MDTARMNAHVRRMTRTILRQKTLVLSVVLFYSCNVEARMCCNTCMSFALLPFVILSEKSRASLTQHHQSENAVLPIT